MKITESYNKKHRRENKRVEEKIQCLNAALRSRTQFLGEYVCMYINTS